MKNSIQHILLFIVIAVIISCDNEKIDYAKPALISGQLEYEDIRLGRAKVPAGTSVKVKFTSTEGMSHDNYSFTTKQEGFYQFEPQVEGNYSLSFVLVDTLDQFSSALVTKEDIDTIRGNELDTLSYKGTSSIDISTSRWKKDSNFKTENIVLRHTGTDLKITVTDVDKNPLQNIRLCIYSSRQLAAANSPYCGGSLAYLSSDRNGVVVFTGLEAKSYYVNARGNLGTVSLNNQYSDDAVTIPKLIVRTKNEAVIIIK